MIKFVVEAGRAWFVLNVLLKEELVYLSLVAGAIS